MPVPQLSEKLRSKPILTGVDMITYRRQTGRFPDMPAPDGVIICLETSLPKRMRRRFPYRKVGRFVGDMLMLRREGGRVGVMVNLGVGAPTVAALAEELIAWGTRRLVLVSWAGVLQSGIRNGDIIVCERAIRDEGTSHHYQAEAKYAHADAALTAKLIDQLNELSIEHRTGATWTTDAPYRETEAEVRTYQQEGVLAVEMEAAALFTVGAAHQIQTTAAFVAGDSLAHFRWQPPQDIEAINHAFDALYAALVALLRDD